MSINNEAEDELNEIELGTGDIDIKSMLCFLIIIASNIIVFFATAKNLYNFQGGGINYNCLIENQQYIRLLTHMFIHADFGHLTSNMLALFVLGSVVEKNLGSFRSICLYFISGVGAAFISVYISHFTNPDSNVYSAGASGAVYGVLASAMVLTAYARHGQDPSYLKRGILFAVLYAIFSISTGVDVWAHIGGAIIGGVLTFLICKLGLHSKPEIKFIKILAIIITIIVCLFGITKSVTNKGLNDIPDSRKDYIQERPVFNYPTVTYKELLNSCTKDATWFAFTSDSGQNIVEFTGMVTYQNTEYNLLIQFDIDTNMIVYFSFDDLPQQKEKITEFFKEKGQEYDALNKN